MQKGFALIIILVGILVVVTVAGGAYYIVKSQIPKPQPQNPVVSQTPQPSPSSSSLLPVVTKNNETLTPELQKQILPLDETANWKTYTNTSYDYSMEYPAGSYINEDNPNDVTFSKNPANSGQSGYDFGVLVSPAKDKTLQDVADFFDVYKSRNGYSRTKITIDTVFGYRLTNVAMDFPTDAVSLLKDGSEYFIFVKYYEQNQSVKTEGEKGFNRILSTFKFNR